MSDTMFHPLSTTASTTSSVSESPLMDSPTSSAASSPKLTVMDEVTTIFVVGFPDDMQEREFQNMFLFVPGFEGASLKWHSKDQSEEEYLNKQMIGFAKFKSRHEAMDAAKQMNGKKVDIEKGSILKAEMAKKNLHIKRNSIVPGASPNNLLPSALPLPQPASNLTKRLSVIQPEISISPSVQGNDVVDYESFSPLPSDLLSPGDYKKTDPFLNDPYLEESMRSNSIDYNIPNAIGIKNTLNLENPFDYLSKSSPSIVKNDFPFNLDLKQKNDEFSLRRQNSLQPISNNEKYLGNVRNLADQNPPCNTLYVGNLPPNTVEDELRSLFSTCEGFKRMHFRQKSQGPMCFVEFEDIIFATQAMKQNQGHLLSNSTKGGIRLSFSKNPLFIKPNKQAEISFGFKQLGAALLADA